MFKNTSLVRLGDRVDTQSGGTPNTKKSEYYDEGSIPWLSSGEINQGYISSTEKYITEEGLANSAAKWVPKNSVVSVEYDEWLHNHPIKKFKFMLSFEDAKILLGDV